MIKLKLIRKLRKKKLKIGKNMEKILLLLLAGFVIGLSRSESTAYFIIKHLPHELKKINKKHLNLAIKNLYQSKLVGFKENEDKTITLILTKKGKEVALTYNLDKLKFKKEERWDGYWRLIIFDIPEKFKNERNFISLKLKQAGAYPLQKSVFVYPYDIRNELDFLIEFLDLRKYVRTILAKNIDNELHLKKIFNLL